ncbi:MULTISPECIES: ribonuclease HI family protein [Mammaliicoccus]|uniref:ribonuclease HI family protein n=1 Tax=Mammaliicoccus TaxID=2803850 RepID=UPI000991FC62|nr:ribonuclease HI family protein [Mammaliicoccus fleurettii]MBO3062543.1 ribonuclease HI family protein [Mammaliicoccus fleurettii]MEB7724955.1 ribonuclease HI family protein [Mammaliicoccus fleurettii]MEB7779323.1 ribonuclease HI family protein [Mammaliicoccus fleurettii]MEB8067098.1 ribonuclease HI family protein [Mammaliicoccus fleurettii]OOV78657.1 ribonuclease H [Mammaliicoccus fleurettii]
MSQIYFDAATKGNPGESTCGIVIIVDNERHYFTESLGLMDNHRAEWEAFILSLKHAAELNVNNALVYTDSKLIGDSIEKNFVKNEMFKSYFNEYKQLQQKFDLVFVKWIPRVQNKEANQLAQTALRKHLKKRNKK